MIILIGAESSTGKTLMAQKLLEIYKIPYLSVDHLKMGLYRSNINFGFKPDDSNEIIEEHLWPILKGMIDTSIENNQNMIIEGCYIFPKRMKEFSSDYKDQIIPVFMGFSKRYLENNFISDVLKYRDVIEWRGYAEDRTIEWFIDANRKMKTMCKESEMPYFEINKNYNQDIESVYKWIASEMERIKI